MGNAHREVKEASTDSQDLDGLAKKDGLAKGDGEPLFVRVENVLRHQAPGGDEWKVAGPPAGSISDSAQKEERLLAVENDFYPLFRFARHGKLRGKQERCCYHSKTQYDIISTAKEKGAENLPQVHPLTKLGVCVCDDGHKIQDSRTNKKFVKEVNKAARHVDLRLTHSFPDSRDEAAKDLDDAEKYHKIHRSTLSLPSTRVSDSEGQLLGPLSSAHSGNSLFMTSQSLDVHLTPYGEKMVLSNGSSTDLSQNLESWMSLLPEALQHLPLNYLYIPGENPGTSS